jgi:hypothetical protein
MAADSVLNYNNIVDFRYKPFTQEFDPLTIGRNGNPVERRTVPNSAPYEIKLFEVPEQTTPSSMRVIETVSGDELDEVSLTATPASKQYRATYYNELSPGLLGFNSAQAGVQMDISYNGLGHGYQKISLDTRVPDTGNTTINGVKTFTGNVIFSGDPVFTSNPTFEDIATFEDNTYFTSGFTHPFTAVVPANVFLRHSAGLSGFVNGYGAGKGGLILRGYGALVDTGVDTTKIGCINNIAWKTDGGTGATAPTGNDVIFTITAGGSTRFIVHADGDYFTDSASAGGEGTGDYTPRYYDKENDLMLSDALRKHLGGKYNEIRKNKELQKYKNKLEELGIMQNNFISAKGMMALNMGTDMQLFNMIREIAKILNISKDKLLEFAKKY